NLKIKTAALRLMMLSKNKTYQRRIFAFGDFISCPAVSYNRALLQDFKFDEEMKVSLDWEAWERIMRRPGAIYFLPQKLMGHRIHAGSETTNMIQDATRDSEDFIMFRRYWGVRMARFLTRLYSNSQKTNQ
ncbi:MAG: glycosyltransferase family 2 protein, partial [Streptococcaceae bacterium]|nr:glycosyltransferase family 2 protein [Streptococcaceae bacterium]